MANHQAAWLSLLPLGVELVSELPSSPLALVVQVVEAVDQKPGWVLSSVSCGVPPAVLTVTGSSNVTVIGIVAPTWYVPTVAVEETAVTVGGGNIS
jgi:hypothetical protein